MAAKENGPAVNLIGKNTSIEGVINSESSIIIHGKVKGEIYCKETVTVGVEGYIEGILEAKNAIVGGTLSGKITISEKLVLESKAALYGELKTNRLVIDEGAVLDGKSEMDSKAKNKPPMTASDNKFNES
jgi:cytoskeletal protein CcmA (bactofilin family)